MGSSISGRRQQDGDRHRDRECSDRAAAHGANANRCWNWPPNQPIVESQFPIDTSRRVLMELKDAMEQTEHISHAAHGHDEGGHGDPRLGPYIGITMAVLGVLLAFCAAKVGGERTELVQALVEQSNAHAQYHAQDVKHRVAVIGLQQVHATAFGSGADTLNKSDVLGMAGTVERYLKESNLAKNWSASFDPAVLAHV